MVMTKIYPKLTKENVEYWYWMCDPGWSQIDIAKAVGCNPGTVSHFMKRSGIPTRNSSDAQLERYACPHKREDFENLMSSSDVRMKIAEGMAACWDDTDRNRSLIKANQDRVKFIVGFTQFKILETLGNVSNASLLDLVNMENLLHFTKKGLDLALGRLTKRRFIKRYRKSIYSTSNVKVYYYSITDLGKQVYNLNNTQEMKEKMEKWLKINRRITSNLSGPRIGKTQSQILNLFAARESVFSSEITTLLTKLSINKSSIQHALKLLVENNFLYRRKEYNITSSYKNKFEFRYYSSTIPQINSDSSYEGLGSNQLLLLQSFRHSEGMFFRELQSNKELSNISPNAIDNTLLKLTRKNFLERERRKDKKDNRVKYFYILTPEGKEFLNKIIMNKIRE